MNKKLLLGMCLSVWMGVTYAEEITIDPIDLIAAGETQNVNINLINESTDIGAIQFSLHLPAGVTIVEDQYGFVYDYYDRLKYGRNNYFEVTIDDWGNGEYFFLIHSGTSGSGISGTSGTPILYITVQASDQISTTGNVAKVTGQVFADANSSNAYYHEDTTFDNVTLRVAAKIGSSGYCSFSWPRNLDFTGCENFTNVFYGKSETETSVVVSSIDDFIVPAGTGVIVKGTAGQPVYPNTTDQTSDVSSIFTATSSAPVTVTTKGEAYALAVINGTGFYPCNAGVTIPQYKCYLPGSVAAKSFIAIHQETNNEQVVSDDAGIVDGINNVNSDVTNDAYYDVQGRRITTPRHGVYIQNGKKVIIK
ncbi:MAG: hypothetical protein IJK87_02190 [Prevotella sp.]|nr:hypothetical protein [Prevotella sp.]